MLLNYCPVIININGNSSKNIFDINPFELIHYFGLNLQGNRYKYKKPVALVLQRQDFAKWMSKTIDATYNTHNYVILRIINYLR